MEKVVQVMSHLSQFFSGADQPLVYPFVSLDAVDTDLGADVNEEEEEETGNDNENTEHDIFSGYRDEVQTVPTPTDCMSFPIISIVSSYIRIFVIILNSNLFL